jgi:hypothetical protein
MEDDPNPYLLLKKERIWEKRDDLSSTSFQRN